MSVARSADDRAFYLGAGPLAAMLLGSVLIPLRERLPASNLTYPFVILIIVVSALGGRAAGVVTAVVAALSLNFFLTRPYLTLHIEARQDVIAFGGLAACGLVGAALASPERAGALREARRHLALLDQALHEVEGSGPLLPAVSRILAAARQALPIHDLVLRDGNDRLVASTGGGPTTPEGPPTRIALVSNHRRVGTLDVWKDRRGETEASRRTLSDVARVLGVLLARESGG
jgi:hypothetical protein